MFIQSGWYAMLYQVKGIFFFTVMYCCKVVHIFEKIFIEEILNMQFLNVFTAHACIWLILKKYLNYSIIKVHFYIIYILNNQI